jgi:UDP-GlcNAc:undecaprenyl-phosphate/decaprenyl-phosphate GlcNAc-1-phosphate transferase
MSCAVAWGSTAQDKTRLVLRQIQSRPTDVGFVGRLVSASIGATVARISYQAIDARDRAGEGALVRLNHQGETVTLAQGPASVAGSAVAVLLTPSLATRVRAAGALSVLACGALGLYDDLAGGSASKGLKGHFTALANGEVTSGAIKVAGIGAVALVAGPLARGGRGGVVDAGLSAILVAATANAVNLFDLRPGRAVKVFLGGSAPALLLPGSAGSLLAGPAGATVALGNEDLQERSMLGDTGANALGALLGTAGASSLSRKGLLAAVITATAVTVVSEKVSYSRVIESQPWLRRIDDWGRRST